MRDSVEEVIKEIAAKNGITIGRDDPILALYTMNELLLKESARGQQDILNHFKEELEAIAFRWEEEAKKKAERILNAALLASKEAMTNAVKAGAQKASETMLREINESAVKLKGPVDTARKVAFLNIIASLMMLFGAGLLFLISS